MRCRKCLSKEFFVRFDLSGPYPRPTHYECDKCGHREKMGL